MAAIPAANAPLRMPRFAIAAAVLGAILAAALGAAYYMESNGHVVTGMDNQVVWGMPHVFAFFLIVAASGALNIASIGSVFRNAAYKPHGPLSVLLAVALLAGGLMVLVLDLGRPERLLVAAMHYNFGSVFAWNMWLYSGFFAIGVVYLWTLLERRFNRHAPGVGLLAFAWRITLTTATGSVLGFLVARKGFSSAVIAPLFIAFSLAWGLAAFCLALAALGRLRADTEFARRLGRLLGLFVIAALWLCAVYHATNLYWARQADFERFILLDGKPYAALFWIGFVAVGSLAPLGFVFHPKAASARAMVIASALVIAGAFAFLYVFVIGGQAFPLEIFSGYDAASDFADGRVNAYAPTLAEVLLGAGGVALAALLTTIGVRVLPILPADE